MKKVKDDRLKHVYCTDCVYWLSLYNHIEFNNIELPKSCVTCFPYNPEDSVKMIKRINYKEREVVLDYE
jgi:hypothetical protein